MVNRKGKPDSGFFGNGPRRIVAWTLAVKAAVLLLILLGYYLFQFQSQNFQANYHYPAEQPINLSTHYMTWDAQFYLSLAEQGYAPQQARNAFYPLFPFLIYLASFIFLGNSLLAGLVLSAIFTTAAMAYLFLLVREKYGEKTAAWTCLFILSFPMAFYSGLVYSESLFLMLSVMLFYYLRKGNNTAAAVCGFFLSLTRPTGILVVIPALVECFRQGTTLRVATWAGQTLRTTPPKYTARPPGKPGALAAGKSGSGKSLPGWGRMAVPFGFVLGLAAYLGLMRSFTGSAFGGFEAQKAFAASHSFGYLLHPWLWAKDNFLHGDFSLNGVQTGLMNEAVFLAAVGIAVFSFKKLDRTFWVYLLVIGILPALSGYLTAYARFASVVFPFFIFLALTLKKHPEYYLWLCLLLQALFVLMHSLNHYVA
jgi:hypothetical protein